MADGALTVSTVADADAFAALAPEWDGLVHAMPRPSPWLLHAWLDAWWRHFGEGRELSVQVAHSGGRLAAALPLFVERRRGVRVARFLGGHESPLADLLVAPGEGDRAARAVVEAATGAADALAVFGLPGGSRLGEALGGRLQTVERVEAPVLDLPDGWSQAYERKTGAKRRALHRRRRRQLAELGRLETSVARSPADLERALEEAFRLHQERWRGRPDGSTFGSSRGQAFHRDALRAIAPADAARIVTLALDGRAVAFHYFFVVARTMYVHRLAFDPALARFSPGVVNTLDAIEAAAAEGVVRVEFLGGTERYKLELADRFEPLHEGFAAFRGIRPRALVLGRRAELAARLRLKRSERLRRVYYRRRRRGE